MLFRTVPTITPRYWAGLALASVFGANMGDLVSHTLHMGHISGVPALALAFAAIAAGGRRGRSEAWYWLAIVTIRTAATNLADLATHDGALGYAPVSAGLAVLLLAVLLVRHAVAPDAAAGGVPRTDGGYWLAMLAAGTLGTAAGDGLAHAIGLPPAALLGVLAVVAALGARRHAALTVPATYWLAVVALRTWGTNVGDMAGDALGLPMSTALTGLLLAGLLAAWRERRPAGAGLAARPVP